ncbi:MAG TPA: hypothetical protein VFV66_20885 [Nonomuraea sp.]|nr:hypothetical protein [Nonomuraea sp.]
MLLPNADGPGGDVEVHPPQGRYLAPPQAGEGGEEDQGAEAYRRQLCQLEHLRHGEDRPFFRLLLARAPDAARVARDDLIVGRHHEHGPQEAVRLGDLRPADAVAEQHGSPLADDGQAPLGLTIERGAGLRHVDLRSRSETQVSTMIVSFRLRTRPAAGTR